MKKKKENDYSIRLTKDMSEIVNQHETNRSEGSNNENEDNSENYV